jgi:hypothetical protein
MPPHKKRHGKHRKKRKTRKTLVRESALLKKSRNGKASDYPHLLKRVLTASKQGVPVVPDKVLRKKFNQILSSALAHPFNEKKTKEVLLFTRIRPDFLDKKTVKKIVGKLPRPAATKAFQEVMHEKPGLVDDSLASQAVDRIVFKAGTARMSVPTRSFAKKKWKGVTEKEMGFLLGRVLKQHRVLSPKHVRHAVKNYHRFPFPSLVNAIITSPQHELVDEFLPELNEKLLESLKPSARDSIAPKTLLLLFKRKKHFSLTQLRAFVNELVKQLPAEYSKACYSSQALEYLAKNSPQAFYSVGGPEKPGYKPPESVLLPTVKRAIGDLTKHHPYRTYSHHQRSFLLTFASRMGSDLGDSVIKNADKKDLALLFKQDFPTKKQTGVFETTNSFLKNFSSQKDPEKLKSLRQKIKGEKT